jgi:hypothetical protein
MFWAKFVRNTEGGGSHTVSLALLPLLLLLLPVGIVVGRGAHTVSLVLLPLLLLLLLLPLLLLSSVSEGGQGMFSFGSQNCKGTRVV